MPGRPIGFRPCATNECCSARRSRPTCPCSESASAASFSRAPSGATSAPPRRPEIGWLEIAPTDGAGDDPVFSVLEQAVGVYQWHSDVFEPPAGASVLARSQASPNQAFRVDGVPAWGIQFHPETTPGLWELWISRHPNEVREAGVDVDALRAAVQKGAAESLAFCTALFDAFIDVVRAR